MVATALKRAGHQVEMFDFLQNGCSYEAVCEKLKKENPDLVGLSLRNIDNVNAVNEHRYIDSVQKIVKTVRAEVSATIVLGGSAFSIMPEEMMAKIGADYGVVGEGEVLICELVENITEGRLPKQKILRAPQQLENKEIPAAYYDSEMVEYYMAHGKTISIQTKRGCNKHCIYCSYPFLEGRRLRMRDPRRLLWMICSV